MHILVVAHIYTQSHMLVDRALFTNGLAVATLLHIKGALNPNFLNFTKNREKFCVQKRFGPIS